MTTYLQATMSTRLSGRHAVLSLRNAVSKRQCMDRYGRCPAQDLIHDDWTSLKYVLAYEGGTHPPISTRKERLLRSEACEGWMEQKILFDGKGLSLVIRSMFTLYQIRCSRGSTQYNDDLAKTHNHMCFACMHTASEQHASKYSS